MESAAELFSKRDGWRGYPPPESRKQLSCRPVRCSFSKAGRKAKTLANEGDNVVLGLFEFDFAEIKKMGGAVRRDIGRQIFENCSHHKLWRVDAREELK